MDTTSSSPGTWQVSLALIGAVATTIWAAKGHHKGKVWWFLGGLALGSGVGYLIDKI